MGRLRLRAGVDAGGDIRALLHAGADGAVVGVRLIALALLLAVCVQTWRLNAEQAGRTADRAAYASAQAEAEHRSLATNVITKGADDAHTPRLAAARAATVRYVDRVRTVGCGRPAETPAAPESPDGAGPTADMVAIRRDDLDILVENSVRLETVHEWGDKLIEDGLAIDVEF